MSKLKSISRIGLLGFVFIFALISCSQFDSIEPTVEDGTELTSVDLGLSPIPVNIPFHWEALRGKPSGNGGNLSCQDLPGAPYEFTSGRNNFQGGKFEREWPKELSVSVKDGKFVSWEYVGVVPRGKCLVMAVIVKGGPANTVAMYSSGVMSGSDIAAPLVGRGNIPDVSNLTFCWSFVDCDNNLCYEDETAWSDGTRYTSQGNWAMFTNVSANAVTSVDLLASNDKIVIGTVEFEKVNNGTKITIELNAIGAFQDVPENIKIQGYDTAPSGNPAPGLFTTFKGTGVGSTFSVVVPTFNFYGVHVDAKFLTECSSEEIPT